MVSHEQRSAVSRAVITALFTLGILWTPAARGQAGSPAAPKFCPDDPLLREPAPHPVKEVAKQDVDDLYDFLYNSFDVPRKEGKRVRQGPQPALDANTLGDVPDSAWYTNRHYYRRMSIEELKRGPGNTTPPSSGTWRIVSAKTNGVTPGFVIEDEHKNRYVLKFDPPDYPELPSASDVIGSKALYALGYNTPENYIVHFRRENLAIGEGVTWRDAAGKKHPLTGRIVAELLKPQPKGPDGTYRGMASRYIAGKLAGPFSYDGMRTDDPNDIVPHEDRRELRGLNVFATWLNHHDTKAVNSMDTLVEENGRQYLKHYLLDFGDILGSDGIEPKYAWSGHEYTIDGKGALVQMVTLGFDVPRWQRAKYPDYKGVGRFDSWSLDPLTWKPNYPNPAFWMMDQDDAFWAAKQVAAFTDAEIRALVETGEYSDPRAAQWVAESLIKRRDKIADAWFSRVLPLDKFSVVDGKLTFEDLGAKRGGGSGQYSVRWTSWDGDGRATPLSEASDTQVPSFRSDTRYLAATFKPAGGAGDDPVTVYLRRGDAGLQVVGIDRR
jgi:hypothetical protein